MADNPDVSDPARESGSENVRKAAAYWDDRHRDVGADAQDNFLRHPLVQAYMSLRAFGQIVSHLDVVVAELRNRTRPGDRILSVGCGGALKERTLARQLPDREFVGFDISAETIQRAGEELRRDGIRNLTLQVADFNQLELDRRAYRAVLGLGAIHHVEALESFWKACADGLTTDGAVLAQEYVGPDRFQWTDAQIREGDRVLRDLVPDRHRTHHNHIERVPVEVMMQIDPSEAVRSSELLPTCRDAGFTIEGYAGAGCALLQPVLMYQIDTFDPEDWEHNHTLALLFREEDRLMRQGVLGDDFAGFVARPPA